MAFVHTTSVLTKRLYCTSNALTWTRDFSAQVHLTANAIVSNALAILNWLPKQPETLRVCSENPHAPHPLSLIKGQVT